MARLGCLAKALIDQACSFCSTVTGRINAVYISINIRSQPAHARAGVHSVATRSWENGHLLVRERARPTGAVDEGPPDLIVASRKASEFQRNRLRRILAIELHSAAAVVLTGISCDLERPVGVIGRHVDSNHQVGRRK